MIPLERERWAKLEHAYGSAADIPELLERAATAPPQQSFKDEPWYTLWSSLCHQGGACTASYAAVPHLVAFAAKRAGAERHDLLALAAAIEVARLSGNGPDLPLEMASAYGAATAHAAGLARDVLVPGLSENVFQALMACCAVFSGHAALGNALFDLERQVVCPSCEHVFTVPGFDEFGEE